MRESDSSLPRQLRRHVHYGALLLIVSLACGCSANNRPVLGNRMTLTPGWERLGRTSKRAIGDPNVWAPLVAAIALQAGDLDQEISDRLREDTPLFGSTEKAHEASDDLRSLSEIAYLSTALLAPGPPGSGEWLLTKSKLAGAEWLMSEALGSITTGIQDYTNREKPNGESNNSMPSYHVSTTTFNTRLADLNTAYLPISEGARRGLGYGYDTIAGLTALARVEAGEHYPSDVLVGYAFGYFMGYIAGDFIAPEQAQLQVTPELGPGYSGLKFSLDF